MKETFVLSMVVSLAMICSCQKQDSAAEQQLVQRKTELDARETALDEREKGLDARERALAERENATTNPSAIRSLLQSRRQVPNAAEAQAERDRRIQQLPPEFRALIPDTSQVKAESRRVKGEPANPAEAQAERERGMQQLPRALSPEDLQREWQRKMNQAKVSGATMPPAADDTSLTPSPTPR